MAGENTQIHNVEKQKIQMGNTKTKTARVYCLRQLLEDGGVNTNTQNVERKKIQMGNTETDTDTETAECIVCGSCLKMGELQC